MFIILFLGIFWSWGNEKMEHNIFFYVIGTGKDYVKAMWEDSIKLQNVRYLESPMINIGRGKKIFEYIESKLYSFRINMRCILPGKKNWRKYYVMNQIEIDNNYTNVVIFSDIMRIMSDLKYWRNLKKNNNVVYCLILLNSCRHDLSRNIKEVRRILDFLSVDIIYTFDKSDSSLLKLEYFPSMLSKLENYSESKIEYDFYFVGKKKNRFKEIIKLYNQLTEQGYKCLFRVTGVNDEEEKMCEGIVYNETISYKQVIEELNLSKCIVDIKVPEQSGLSLRYFEAVIYNKLLLTNNGSVKYETFYNKEYMLYYKEMANVKIEKNFLDKVPDYNYNDNYSPVTFLKTLEGKINDGIY